MRIQTPYIVVIVALCSLVVEGVGPRNLRAQVAERREPSPSSENDRSRKGDVEARSILIDFGAADRRSDGTWNNATEAQQTGTLIEQAIDVQGDWTPVRVVLSDPFSGINTEGSSRAAIPFSRGDDVSEPSAEAAAADRAPSAATSDSFYVGSGGDRLGEVRIEGLSAGQSYSLAFFASRMEAGRQPRKSVYSASGKLAALESPEIKSAELDAANNESLVVRIDGVQPDDDGRLTIRVQCAEPTGYAYLGALRIDGPIATAERRLDAPDSPDGPPLVTAKAWAIADGRSGRLLWGVSESEPRHMASITKVMTAHLICRLIDDDITRLDETVVVSPRADSTSGSSAEIRAGERIAVRDLLFGLLLPSGNDAAVALAEHFNPCFPTPGESPDGEASDRADDAADARDATNAEDAGAAEDTMSRFIHAMNRRAAELGMNETRYFDPHGNSRNRSTALDLARLAYVAMQHERLRQYCGTSLHRADLKSADGSSRVAVWRNTNRLLGIAGYDGIKTGTTSGAGACLLSSGRRGERSLLVVVLGSASNDSRYIDTRNLYRWAWSQLDDPGERE